MAHTAHLGSCIWISVTTSPWPRGSFCQKLESTVHDRCIFTKCITGVLQENDVPTYSYVKFLTPLWFLSDRSGNGFNELESTLQRNVWISIRQILDIFKELSNTLQCKTWNTWNPSLIPGVRVWTKLNSLIPGVRVWTKLNLLYEDACLVISQTEPLWLMNLYCGPAPVQVAMI